MYHNLNSYKYYNDLSTHLCILKTLLQFKHNKLTGVSKYNSMIIIVHVATTIVIVYRSHGNIVLKEILLL